MASQVCTRLSVLRRGRRAESGRRSGQGSGITWQVLDQVVLLGCVDDGHSCRGCREGGVQIGLDRRVKVQGTDRGFPRLRPGNERGDAARQMLAAVERNSHVGRRRPTGQHRVRMMRRIQGKLLAVLVEQLGPSQVFRGQVCAELGRLAARRQGQAEPDSDSNPTPRISPIQAQSATEIEFEKGFVSSRRPSLEIDRAS